MPFASFPYTNLAVPVTYAALEGVQIPNPLTLISLEGLNETPSTLFEP